LLGLLDGVFTTEFATGRYFEGDFNIGIQKKARLLGRASPGAGLGPMGQAAKALLEDQDTQVVFRSVFFLCEALDEFVDSSINLTCGLQMTLL
jgi:hypothetical protein